LGCSKLLKDFDKSRLQTENDMPKISLEKKELAILRPNDIRKL
jgi:hypothetical protein